MSVRLAEIAQQAGVSTATVSRVLNGKSGISTAKRQAVLTALDVLGCERPRELRTSRAGLIGLIVPELSSPIFPTFAQFIQSALMTRGYSCVLCTQEPGGVTEDDYTELLLERGVSGIIFVSGLHADSRADVSRYERLIARGLPIVMVNGTPDPETRPVKAPSISIDEEGGLELGVRHLAALGHRRIGLAVGQERYVPVLRKKAGYLRAMAEATPETPAADLIRHTLFTLEGGQAAARRLLDQGCSAICCASETMAIGVIRAVRELGLDVPTDVSVVGFDDSPLMAYLDPPLTTIRQPVREMSQAAVTALMDAIHGGQGDMAMDELLFRPELVVRSSTGAVRS